jgi:hypothetical protein
MAVKENESSLLLTDIRGTFDVIERVPSADQWNCIREHREIEHFIQSRCTGGVLMQNA